MHDPIIAGLLFLSGAASGSPLDPSDSLVIPAGMAVALWAWRSPTIEPSSIRSRLGLLAAVAAAFATIATSPNPVALGVTSVWVEPAGTVMASAGYLGFSDDHFASEDGGLTWKGFPSRLRDHRTSTR